MREKNNRTSYIERLDDDRIIKVASDKLRITTRVRKDGATIEAPKDRTGKTTEKNIYVHIFIMQKIRKSFNIKFIHYV